MLKSFVIVLAVAAVAAQAASPAEVLTKEGLTKAVELAQISGAAKALTADAKVTILAPTNAAIEAFLKEMGITIDYLKKTEALADKLLAYHMIMGIGAGPEKFFAESNTIVVPTASFPYNITLTKTKNGMTITDFQGNVANVVKSGLGGSNFQVHVIDRVLYSGAYWPSLKKLVKSMPGYFSTVAAAAEKAGLSLTPERATVFLPVNSAFKKAGIALDADAATIKNVLLYHVVEGDRTIPNGFVSGEKVKTLEGQDITVTYVMSDKKMTANMMDATAYVTDARGNKAMVVHPNMFVGSNEVQVVDGVLLPKAKAMPAATTKPATTTTKITTTMPTMPVPASASLAITNPVVQGAGMKSTVNMGRKLMQNANSQFSQYASTAAQDATSAAILNAVNSNADLATTMRASTVGTVASKATNPSVRFGVADSFF